MSPMFVCVEVAGSREANVALKQFDIKCLDGEGR